MEMNLSDVPTPPLLRFYASEAEESPQGPYPKTLDLGPKINILKYAPKDVAVTIMKKLPPKDLRELCKVKDRRIRELCQNFLSRKDYQRIWGGKFDPKLDQENYERELSFLPPHKPKDPVNLEILIHNLKGQPKDIQKMILLKTDPETFLALCSIKDRRIQQGICSDEDFIEKYGKLYKKELNLLLVRYSHDGKDKDLKILLSIFGDLVDPSTQDNMALVSAVTNGHYKVVKVLLEDDRVDPSADDNKAMRMAAENGEYYIVKLLLKDSRVDPSAQDNYAIRWAAKNGHTEVVKLLLEDSRVDPSADDNYAIGMAARNGHLEVVKLLLKDPRVDPSADDNYALRKAVEYGHLEVVKLLLKDNRVDPRADDNYAIGKAAENGEYYIVKLLLKDSRVDPGDDDNYAIRAAVEYGHTEVVKLLLEDRRVNPSVYDNYVIRVAAQEGYLEVVKVLLKDPRVDPSADDNYALRKAEENGHTKVVKLLKKYFKSKESNVVNVENVPDVYDIIEMEEVSAKDFLNQDPNNIIFVIGNTSMGYNKKDLYESTIKSKDYFYECKNKKALRVALNDIVKPAYAIIRGQGNYYVPALQLKSILKSKSRVFKLVFGKDVKYMASKTAIDVGGMQNWRGEDIDLVGAWHCQEGTNVKTYDIVPF